jgi:hypothetical protein
MMRELRNSGSKESTIISIVKSWHKSGYEKSIQSREIEKIQKNLKNLENACEV